MASNNMKTEQQEWISYEVLCKQYLEDCIVVNEQLPNGMVIRRKVSPPPINRYPSLKKYVQAMMQMGNHTEIHRVLHELALFEQCCRTKTFPWVPTEYRHGSNGNDDDKVIEVINLLDEESPKIIIDAENEIVKKGNKEVLISPLKTEDKQQNQENEQEEKELKLLGNKYQKQNDEDVLDVDDDGEGATCFMSVSQHKEHEEEEEGDEEIKLDDNNYREQNDKEEQAQVVVGDNDKIVAYSIDLKHHDVISPSAPVIVLDGKKYIRKGDCVEDQMKMQYMQGKIGLLPEDYYLFANSLQQRIRFPLQSKQIWLKHVRLARRQFQQQLGRADESDNKRLQE